MPYANYSSLDNLQNSSFHRHQNSKPRLNELKKSRLQRRLRLISFLIYSSRLFWMIKWHNYNWFDWIICFSREYYWFTNLFCSNILSLSLIFVDSDMTSSWNFLMMSWRFHWNRVFVCSILYCIMSCGIFSN